MERVPCLAAHLRRLAIAACALGCATLAAAQSDDSGAEELNFDEHFSVYDITPPLYRPGEDEEAVDLTQIEIPLAGSRVIRDLGMGKASFYGKRFHGRTTANGESFDMHALTAAHRTLPFGSLVRVTNPRNGLSVTVRINDRGPFARGRVIDLSRAAAEQIGMIRRGHAEVELQLVE